MLTLSYIKEKFRINMKMCSLAVKCFGLFSPAGNNPIDHRSDKQSLGLSSLHFL